MNLDHAQAEWTLGRFPYPQLPELAAQMMMQGFEGPAILELVSFHRPGRWDVPAELVDRAFREAGRTPLPPMRALWLLAEREARGMVRGEVTPLEGASRILRHVPWGEEWIESPFYRLDEWVELWDRDDQPCDRDRYERLMLETAWEFLER